MKKTYTKAMKRKAVKQYQDGISIDIICSNLGVAKSTLYSWIKTYKIIPTKTDAEITYRDYYDLKRRANKLQSMVEVLQKADCTCFSPLQEKLVALEKLYDQYNNHVLCEALGVALGTFSNHIHRNKRNNTVFVKRREELRELIQQVYDDSNQLYGANKIRAILSDRGYVVSDRMVAKLMHLSMSLFTTKSCKTSCSSTHFKRTGVITFRLSFCILIKSILCFSATV